VKGTNYEAHRCALFPIPLPLSLFYAKTYSSAQPRFTKSLGLSFSRNVKDQISRPVWNIKNFEIIWVTIREIFCMLKSSHSFNKFRSSVPCNGQRSADEGHDMVDWARPVIKQISSSCQIMWQRSHETGITHRLLQLITGTVDIWATFISSQHSQSWAAVLFVSTLLRCA
jgi:hypothetical protein